jgi:hypothetical protein
MFFFKVDTFTDTNYNNLSLVTENLTSTRYDQLRSHEKLRTRISVAKQPIKLALALIFKAEHKREYYTLQQNKFLITYFQTHVANANLEYRKKVRKPTFFFYLYTHIGHTMLNSANCRQPVAAGSNTRTRPFGNRQEVWLGEIRYGRAVALYRTATSLIGTEQLPFIAWMNVPDLQMTSV